MNSNIRKIKFINNEKNLNLNLKGLMTPKSNFNRTTFTTSTRYKTNINSEHDKFNFNNTARTNISTVRNKINDKD